MGAPDCLVIGGRRVVIRFNEGAMRFFPQWRYAAVWRDYEPGDPIGYGATELEAAADLKRKCDEMEPE